MRTVLISILALTLFGTSCQSTCCDESCGETNAAPIDMNARKALFAAVSSLEGKWEGMGPDGNSSFTTFEVSSGGSVVREFMAQGTPYEMTNMYTLDGNDLVCVHYCAIGNQPRMRASSIENDQIAFASESVGDMKTEDDMYMGELTIVLHDADNIEQKWRSFRSGKIDNEMSISMKRVR